MREITDRELEVMHVFWEHGEMSASEARDALADAGPDLAYVTVANLTRSLWEKSFLGIANMQRPFRYKPLRSFAEVSRELLGDSLERVFKGSREQLLVSLFSRRRPTAKERAVLQKILKGQKR
jgi:BlaI family transcriptional regulator, penicillinase repressor